MRPTQRVGGVLHTYFDAAWPYRAQALAVAAVANAAFSGHRRRHGARPHRDYVGGTSPYQFKESRPCEAALQPSPSPRSRPVVDAASDGDVVAARASWIYIAVRWEPRAPLAPGAFLSAP